MSSMSVTAEEFHASSVLALELIQTQLLAGNTAAMEQIERLEDVDWRSVAWALMYEAAQMIEDAARETRQTPEQVLARRQAALQEYMAYFTDKYLPPGRGDGQGFGPAASST